MKMEKLAGLSHEKMIKTLRKSYFIQKNKDNTFIRLILEEDKKETLLPAINENDINIKETNLEKVKTSDNFFNAIGYLYHQLLVSGNPNIVDRQEFFERFNINKEYEKKYINFIVNFLLLKSKDIKDREFFPLTSMIDRCTKFNIPKPIEDDYHYYSEITNTLDNI